MLKTNRMNATWHDADIYEGYIVDLIKELSSMVGFTYSLDVTEDGNYGNKKPEGWDGVIGDLLNYVSMRDCLRCVTIISHCKVADIPFHIQGVDIITRQSIGYCKPPP